MGTVGCGFRIYSSTFCSRYAISCASEDGHSLMGGIHVVDRGVVDGFYNDLANEVVD